MKENTRSNIILYLAILFVIFFPTSINGIIFPMMWIVRNGLGIVCALWIARNYIIDCRAKSLALFSLILLSFFTLSGSALQGYYQWGGLRIAWASISGFLPSLLLWCVTLNNVKVSPQKANTILIILSLILIVWGWGLVFSVTPIIKFTDSWYSMLKEDLFESMLNRGKPVMSFGTHSVSAFFILVFFYYHCISVKEGVANTYNFICMALLYILVIPMSSNTAILALVCMTGLFVWSKRSKSMMIFSIIILIIVFVYFWDKGVIQSYIYDIMYGVGSEQHGLSSRYGDSTYGGNLEVIQNVFAIGFLRSNTEFYEMRDSGFMYLLTQGNILVLLLIYSIRYNFMKRNLPKYILISFILFLSLELITASAYISVKIVFAEILTIIMIKSFVSKSKMID